MNRIARWFPSLALALVASCRSADLAPRAGQRGLGLSADLTTTLGCPTSPTVVVTDEATLHAAILAAKPGDVIAVSGTIAIAAGDTLRTPRVTLTCATPGSGLVATGSNVNDVFTAGAQGDVVDQLMLDGTVAGETALLALNDGVTTFAQDVRFTHNTITCTFIGTCIFIVGGTGAVITDNVAHAANSSISGIHLQANGPDPNAIPLPIRIDGAHVERNTLIADVPQRSRIFGSIRPFDGDDLVIADNVIIGPWRNGISATRVHHSRIQGNQMQGVEEAGLRTSQVNGSPIGQVADNVFSGNQVTGAGVAGAFAQFACRNLFLANDLEGNAGGLGAFLDVTTGGNVVAGVENAMVIDNGAFDCDNDGDIDPNLITGGAVGHGPAPVTGTGEDVVRPAHGVAPQ
jgi:hypothetical protein